MKIQRTTSLVLVWVGLTFVLLVVAPLILAWFVPLTLGQKKGDSAAAFLLYTALGVGIITAVRNIRRKPMQVALFVTSLLLSLAVADRLLLYILPSLGLPSLLPVGSSRYHHRYPEDIRMFQKYTPGKSPKSDRVIEVTTNHDGFRTRHSRDGFRGHEVRIAVLGDSFTFGTFVQDGEAYPSVLEDVLQQNGTDAAVVNAGVIGYSPFVEQRVYADILTQYEPTHVLLMLDPTDIGDDHHYSLLAALGDPPGTFPVVDEYSRPLQSPLSSNPPVLFPLHEVQRLRFPQIDYYKFEVTLGSTVERNRFFIYRHPLSETRPYFEKTYSVITDISRLAKENGASFTLLVSPRFHHWNKEACPDNWEIDFYSLREPYEFEYFRFFEEKRALNEVSMVNLLPYFSDAREQPLVFEHDPHWNPAGNRFVAEVLARLFRERRL